jgi:dolichol-phosphate mannosyltransferase
MAYLRELANSKPYVRVIDLSRNFGQHIALSCGYRYATGNYVGMLNVDMQDPPNQIPLLLAALHREEVDIVLGLRRDRRSGLLENLGSRAFAWTLNKLTGTDSPLNVATLRIMTRRFVDAYNELQEKSRYIPGLELWIGFRRAYVEIEHRPRTRGRSSYTLKKRLLMAFDSIISFSDLPLRLVVFLGAVIALVGLALGLTIVAQKLFFMDFLPGYASTLSAIVFIGGIQILVTGVASLYIGRILKEVQNRPLYIVKEKINF